MNVVAENVPVIHVCKSSPHDRNPELESRMKATPGLRYRRLDEPESFCDLYEGTMYDASSADDIVDVFQKEKVMIPIVNGLASFKFQSPEFLEMKNAKEPLTVQYSDDTALEMFQRAIKGVADIVPVKLSPTQSPLAGSVDRVPMSDIFLYFGTFGEESPAVVELLNMNNVVHFIPPDLDMIEFQKQFPYTRKSTVPLTHPTVSHLTTITTPLSLATSIIR
jgi:hypothetical protein